MPLFIAFLLICSTALHATQSISNYTVVEPLSLKSTLLTSDSREKELIFHYVSALKKLRLITFFQTHRHSLKLLDIIEKSFNPSNITKTKKNFSAIQFKELSDYIINFYDNLGPYDAYNNEKFLIKESSPQIIERWIKQYTDSITTKEIVLLLTDPQFEVKEYLDGSNGDDLASTGGNLYEKGISKNELDKAIKDGLELIPNARVIKNKTSSKIILQKICLEETTLPEDLHQAIVEGVDHLKQALAFNPIDGQKKIITELIGLLTDGNKNHIDKMIHAFISDKKTSKIKLYANFEFNFFDHNATLSKFDGNVFAVEQKLIDDTIKVAKQASAFEEKLPYGRYRRKFPVNYSPGIAFLTPIFRAGPREAYGLNLTDSTNSKQTLNLIPVDPIEKSTSQALKRSLRLKLANVIPQTVINNAVKYNSQSVFFILFLHEFVGHGSGKVNSAKYPNQDPYTAMGPEGTSLEEMRANLVAIFLSQDTFFNDTFFSKNQKESAKLLEAWLYQYISLISQSTLTQDTFSWPHFRAGIFLINFWLEKNVLTFNSEKGIFEIPDLKNLVAITFEHLRDVQLLRAERNELKLHQLYEKYAPVNITTFKWVQALRSLNKPQYNDPNFLIQPFDLNEQGNLEVIGVSSKPETYIFQF